jgi:hypothetical protein
MNDGNGANINFDLWHPLDHWPWQRRCRQFYGGWRRHLWLAWSFEYREEIEWWLLRPFYLLFLCRLGRHKLTTSWQRGRGYEVSCWYCDYRRPARADEEFPLPPGDQPSE